MINEDEIPTNEEQQEENDFPKPYPGQQLPTEAWHVRSDRKPRRRPTIISSESEDVDDSQDDE